MVKKRRVSLLLIESLTTIMLKSSFAAGLDYNYVITSESQYIDSSCVVSSGAIIQGQSLLYTFQGTPHYKISPYESNFAANALLDDPTPLQLGDRQEVDDMGLQSSQYGWIDL